MKDLKKILIVGVILLFIGVAVAPNINTTVVKASTDDDLVEVATQACGIQGYGDTTVKLTREQYQNLEQYLVEFRGRLNQTTAKEEVVDLFKEAMAELEKYGLLPTDILSERASSSLLLQYSNENFVKLRGKSFKDPFLVPDNTSNALCLIAGHTTETRFLSLSSRASFILFLIIAALAAKVGSSGYKKLGLLLLGAGCPLFIHFGLSYFLGNMFPLSISQWIRFGTWVSRPGYVDPAEGWIYTLGAYGKKSWNQTFHGAMTQDFELNIGAIGFTGIKLCIPQLDCVSVPYTTFFFGSALLVNIEKIS